MAQQRHEQEVTLQKLRAHDEAAKKAINQLQTDLQSKLNNVCHPLPRRIVFILTVMSICDFYLQMVRKIYEEYLSIRISSAEI